MGSSRKIKLGLVINSTPIEVLFLSPPETPLIRALPTLVLAQSWRPRAYKRDSTLVYLSFSGSESLKLAVKLKISLGVIVAIKISSYWTKAIKFPNFSISLTSSELILRLPVILSLWSILADKKFNKVVLPDPEGPKIAVNYPCFKQPLMFFKMGFSSMWVTFLPSTLTFF